MPQRILIDTGPIVAVLDRRDSYHETCKEQAQQLPEVVYTCWPVITEASYLLRSRPDLVDRLLEMVHEGHYELLDISRDEIIEIGGILAKYRDQQVDLADACLAYLAERETIETIFTIDGRHFRLFRNAEGKALRLVPGGD